MGNTCFQKRNVQPKEKRIYKELVIEALQSDPSILTKAECIVNIDIDPENSQLNQLIQQVILEERGKISQPDDLSEMSDRKSHHLDLELGVWKIEQLQKRLFQHTQYIAHLKIDTQLTQEILIKIYSELFFALANKNIQYVVMPQMWLDQHQYSCNQRENADALFDQLFTWRNNDQKYRATFVIFHSESQQSISIVDSFLTIYNQYNPIIMEDKSNSRDQDNLNDDEEVEDDQKQQQ